MEIQVEFNTDLALREYGAPDRRPAECLPNNLRVDEVSAFWKKGQRNYWLDREIPLREIKDGRILSSPLASVIVLEATHFKQDGKIWTRGQYKVVKVFNPTEETVHFDGVRRRI